MADLAEKYSKPIALCLYSRQAELAELHQDLKYPIFVSPERAVAALDMAIKYHERKLFLAENNEIIPPDPLSGHSEHRERIDSVAKERRSILLHEALEIVKSLGLDVPEFALTKDTMLVWIRLFPQFAGTLRYEDGCGRNFPQIGCGWSRIGNYGSSALESLPMK